MKLKEILLVLVGTIVLSLTMVKSGLTYSFGMGFWGANGHDGIWHMALIESLSRGSWDMPTFAGETLKNYHIGFDLLLAILHKVTNIPVVNLYFQVIPPILALLIGILTYKFVLLWRGSKATAFWSTFFVYFGGGFGWIVTLLRDGGLGGESMFWAQQAISTLINPPFALSLVLILLGMILLLKRKKPLLAILVFGILIQIKAYAGLLVLAGLFLSGIHEYLKERKFALLKIFLGTLLVSLFLFLPFNPSSQKLIFFKPFWFLETMMGLSDRIGWSRFYSAMTNYKLAGNWVKAIPAYLVAFAIFLVGNLGTRIIKMPLVVKWLRNPKKLSSVEVFVLTVIVTGIIIPIFFLQTGTAWNTIQFAYYSLFFSGILAGIVMAEVLEKSKAKLLYGLGVVILTLPTTIGSLGHYLPARPPAKVSNEELTALAFLSGEPQGTVLTYPFDRVKANEAESNPPRPLYLYESTAYVSAFSQKPVFLEDEVNLDITRYEWGERKLAVEKFYSTLNLAEARQFLSKNNIAYVYLLKGQKPKLQEKQLGLIQVFENSLVTVYKVEN